MRPEAPPGQKPYIVTSAIDAAAVLTEARMASGLTGEELDAIAGCADRYTAKLERPESTYGKRGLHISAMWELWADALGICLVLMPKRQAEAIGAAPAPVRPYRPNRAAKEVPGAA